VVGVGGREGEAVQKECWEEGRQVSGLRNRPCP
jgi:hypothetical protein